MLALAIPLIGRDLEAQAPTADSAAAARTELLPVLDNDGGIIPEWEIAARIRPGRWRVAKVVIGGLVGSIAFAAMNQPGAQCEPWDPCTPREEWRMNAAPLFGLVIGALTFAAIPGGVDRWHAIELIRLERQEAKQAQSR